MPLHPRRGRAAASCQDWIAAAVTAALLYVPAARAEEFYAGKQIIYIVAAGVGGGERSQR